MSYANGTASVTTTAAVLVTVPSENDGAVIHNRGPVSIYLGSSTVTADQASTGGVEVAPGEKQMVPSIGGGSNALYAVTAAGTATASWLVIS